MGIFRKDQYWLAKGKTGLELFFNKPNKIIDGYWVFIDYWKECNKGENIDDNGKIIIPEFENINDPVEIKLVVCSSDEKSPFWIAINDNDDLELFFDKPTKDEEYDSWNRNKNNNVFPISLSDIIDEYEGAVAYYSGNVIIEGLKDSFDYSDGPVNVKLVKI